MPFSRNFFVGGTSDIPKEVLPVKKTLALAAALLLLLTACAPDGAEETPSAPPESVPAGTPAPESTPPAPESPAPSQSAVYTDWSALEPYRPTQLRFRRWYEEPVHALIPLDGGYGTLVPFVGSAPPDMSWGGVYEYGLMTTDGTIVVDTTYSDVYRLTFRERGEKVRLPVLALMTTEPAADELGWPLGIRRFGAAALDGSWSVPTEYDGIWSLSGSSFFLWKESTVYVYGTDGQFKRSISFSNAAWPWLGDWEYEMKCGGGSLVEQDGNTLWLVEVDTGTRTPVEGVSDVGVYDDGLFSAQDAESGLWGCIDRAGTWVIPAKYEDIWPCADGSGLTEAYSAGRWLWVDREGNEYSEDPRPPQETETEEWDFWVTPVTDSYTGETWYLRSLYRENKPGYLIEDGEGNVLGNSTVDNCGLMVVNGLFLNIDGETAGYKDRDGNWVFRILLAEAGD